ncbi:ABC transporter ATP-binding protein, partial [candidate division KSB1 bacterium]
MAEISLKKVSKIYGKKDEVTAVRDLDLQVRDREFLVLLGPSGCGKTSTLRMIAGLEEITEGEIYFDGRLVNNLPPGERNIAMAFESYALYHLLTVRENIAFPLRTRKTDPSEIEHRVKWAADTLHIADTLDKRPGELSGGQKQRVSLARAIVRDPEVFLLDEPLSHLDMKQKQHMRAELKRLNASMEATTICVTHDQREAMALADRIAVMNDGELIQVGTPTEIYSHPSNEFVAGFIGEPAMNLVDCRIDGGNGGPRLLLNDGSELVRIPEDKVTGPARNDLDTIRLGIRPKQIEYVRSGELNDYIPAIVFAYESVGERGILTVQVGEENLKLITPPREKFKKDTKLQIKL